MQTQEIDILRLYAEKTADQWNTWLRECKQKGDINTLVSTRKGLQMGMASAEKKKLLNEQIINTYCRWIGSIDKTVRAIVKSKDALQNDGVKTAVKSDFDALNDKRQRDADLEAFLKKESY